MSFSEVWQQADHARWGTPQCSQQQMRSERPLVGTPGAAPNFRRNPVAWNIWRFPKIGMPVVIIHFSRVNINQYKASSYWGTYDLGNPHIGTIELQFKFWEWRMLDDPAGSGSNSNAAIRYQVGWGVSSEGRWRSQVHWHSDSGNKSQKIGVEST